MDVWRRRFQARRGNVIAFQPDTEPDFGPLSEREESALLKAYDTIRALIVKYGQNYIEVLHDMLPEWRNPNGSSILVEPDDILMRAGEDVDVINEISAEVIALNSAKLALQAR